MKAFRLAILLALLPLTASPAQAQRNPADGAVLGQVLHSTTAQPVSGATVHVLDEVDRIRAQTTTDGEGAFSFARLDPGPFRIRVRSAGYREVVTPRWWVEVGEVLSVVVRIDPDIVLLAPLEVVGQTRSASPVLSGFYQRLDRRTGGTFITREDIEARAAVRVTDLLADLPGVRFEMDGGSGDPRRDAVITFARAPIGGLTGGRCPVQIFVDGVLATRGRTEVPLDVLASPGHLEGIEVYRGLASVPPEFFTPDARCGVIALWTRRGG